MKTFMGILLVITVSVSAIWIQSEREMRMEAEKGLEAAKGELVAAKLEFAGKELQYVKAQREREPRVVSQHPIWTDSVYRGEPVIISSPVTAVPQFTPTPDVPVDSDWYSKWQAVQALEGIRGELSRIGR